MALGGLSWHCHCPCLFLKPWALIAKYGSVLFWKQMFPDSLTYPLKEASMPLEISYSVVLCTTHVNEIQVRMNHWRIFKWNWEIIVVVEEQLTSSHLVQDPHQSQKDWVSSRQWASFVESRCPSLNIHQIQYCSFMSITGEPFQLEWILSWSSPSF